VHLILMAVVLVVLFAVLRRIEDEVYKPERVTVSELRRRAGHPVERDTASGLLQRHTFVFVSISQFERRLDHRLEDADGITIARALQYPPWTRRTNGSGRPSRFSQVHVEIRDQSDTRIVEIVRPRGFFRVPLWVFDEARNPVGTVEHERRRQFALREELGGRLGTIRRTSALYRVDYTIEDATGAQVGTISDFAHLAKRLGVVGPRLSSKWNQPDEHVLEIMAPVSRDLRLLMLGAAAAVYLTLQKPETDGDGDGA